MLRAGMPDRSCCGEPFLALARKPPGACTAVSWGMPCWSRCWSPRLPASAFCQQSVPVPLIFEVGPDPFQDWSSI